VIAADTDDELTPETTKLTLYERAVLRGALELRDSAEGASGKTLDDLIFAVRSADSSAADAVAALVDHGYMVPRSKAAEYRPFSLTSRALQ
jgi:hypothetical protein